MIAVIDLETTGTDEHADPILEVGCVIVDHVSLRPVDEWTAVAKPASPPKMNAVVTDMHTVNGLLASLDDGRPLADVDRDFAAWLKPYTTKGRVALSGSGVAHFDARFIRAQMPKTARRLTYWTYDVGVVRRVCGDLAGWELPDLTAAKTHRALDDARVHARELLVYTTMLRAAATGTNPHTIRTDTL